MHKGFRFILTGFIVISFGVIIMLVGLAHDGQNNLGWHNGHFEVSQIKSVHHKVKTVNKIDVETANVPVTVQTGDQQGIEIKGRITNPKFLHVTQNDKQLKVRYVPNQEKGYEVGFGKHEPEKLTIGLPKDKKLSEYRQSSMYGAMNIADLRAKRVAITAAAADIQMQDAQLQNLSVAAHDAKIALNNLQANQTTVNSSNSDINTNNSKLGRLMLSADGSKTILQQTAINASAIQVNKGNVKLVDSQLTGHNIMTIMDGSLKASGLTDIGLQMQASAGRVKVDGTNFGNNYLNNAQMAANQFNVDVSDGNITIK
ncbi:DUF4097 domain-containing protein [Weissella fangxianensis]|uniref:DUF4097 domain-containing protein n=1 Tax=Weissella fangxianensis TaxID=2953879 RepID=UPI0021579C2E|nr:DUF4097 domain-containing protein [Weissella fangxianensis]